MTSFRVVLLSLLFLVYGLPGNLFANAGSCEFVLSFIGKSEVPEDPSEIVAEDLDWALFYKAYMPLAVHIAQDKALAEDALQEASLRTFKAIKMGKLSSTNNISAWLESIVRNAVLSEWKREKQRRRLISKKRENLETEPRVISALEFEELRVTLGEFLSVLKPAELSVYLAAHRDGLKRREIAESLGIPLGTALSRVHRAQRRIEEMLESFSPENQEAVLNSFYGD